MHKRSLAGSDNPHYKHGKANTKEYHTWARIKQRTSNPNNASSRLYLYKGIRVCDRWINSFENFFEDMGYAPSPKHSIDRIDSNGNYEPSNCRWATAKVQSNNTSRNKNITFNGITKTQTEWAESVGISSQALEKRLMKWSLVKALTEPRNEKKVTHYWNKRTKLWGRVTSALLYCFQ